MCFRDAFWMGFGMISALFWETFRCQNDAQKEKGRFVELLFPISNIAVFKGSGVNLGCQKERETEWDAELDAKSVLFSFRVQFGSHFGSENRQNSDVDLQHGFHTFCGRSKAFWNSRGRWAPSNLTEL